MKSNLIRAAVALFSLCALTACATPNGTGAQASASIDCPLRDQPYSVDSPIMDILLKPEAMAALEQAVPGITQHMPPQFASVQAPSFSAIMNLRMVSGYGLVPANKLQALDAALRALPITDSDRTARCARYDVEREDRAPCRAR